jgi:hypothetical protein
MMNAISPKPVHESYKRHRRQLMSQIILPMVLSGLVFIALIVLISLATFGRNGDVARWAAISTMWLASHVFVLEFVFLALLVGIIYLLGRLLGITPTYTGKAQNIIHMLMIRIRLAADAAVKPIIFLDSVGASINRFLGRK